MGGPGLRVGGQEILSLTVCLCLASVPGPVLPRSLSHWEMSRVSPYHHNALPRLQEGEEGESRALWACPHAVSLVSKKGPCGRV